jgi:hypothetical protein
MVHFIQKLYWAPLPLPPLPQNWVGWGWGPGGSHSPPRGVSLSTLHHPHPPPLPEGVGLRVPLSNTLSPTPSSGGGGAEGVPSPKFGKASQWSQSCYGAVGCLKMSSLHTPPPPIEEEVWGPAQWDLFFEESVAAFGDVEMAPLEGAKIDPPLNDPKVQPEAPKECTQPQDDPFQSPVFGAENMRIKFLGGGDKQGVLQGCMDSQGKTLCIDLFVSL